MHFKMKRQRTCPRAVEALFVLCLCSATASVLSETTSASHRQIQQDYDFRQGHELCPCSTSLQPLDATANATLIAAGLDPATHGIGCAAHDAASLECTQGPCKDAKNIAPLPIAGTVTCSDTSYCNLEWCYVDPNNCDLRATPSIWNESFRFYSYATCGDVDSFTSSKRISAVTNRVYKVGFNRNSGGWQGAYSESGKQFEGPIAQWSGPTVEFAFEAARAGGFLLNLTEPPEYLRPRSQKYFNSTSSFDFCVYATSLGYLDFCLAQYTVSNQRASTTDWLVLGSQDIYLIAQYEEELSGWELFSYNIGLVFAPFTSGVWFFMLFFVIPVLGCLMIFHEFNHPGSVYPEKEQYLVMEKGSHATHVETMKVPFYRHLTRALYIGMLSVLQQHYDHSVVTYGALINLLGVSFFILTIIAVYTANLAAILTAKVQLTSIDSLEAALESNYRICSERKNLETVLSLYPNIDKSQLALDPEDGLPGFNCPTCAARTRVFDFLDLKLADEDPTYCHAAFAPLEDLESLQKSGTHCNKTMVTQVSSVQTGIPVNENIATELVSLFLLVKNEGVFDRQLRLFRPDPFCPDYEREGQEGDALNISQLTGIWIVSFGLAALGILVTVLWPRIESRKKKVIKPVHQYDQHGDRVNILHKDEKWMEEQSIFKDGKRVFVGNSRWGEAVEKRGQGAVSSSAFIGQRRLETFPEDISGKPRLKSLALAAVGANRLRHAGETIKSPIEAESDNDEFAEVVNLPHEPEDTPGDLELKEDDDTEQNDNKDLSIWENSRSP